MFEQPLDLVVASVEALNPIVHQLTLRATDGAPLPSYAAGAHIRVRIELSSAGPVWRHYSLVNAAPNTQTFRAPGHYTIAVRLVADGGGGSRFMHGLKPGDRVPASGPKNDFPVRTHVGCALLIAGGIGVTPLVSMAAELKATGRAVRMVYAARHHSVMAYLTELKELLGNALAIHSDVDAGVPLDVGALLNSCDTKDHIYVCGPQAMVDAALSAARQRAWPTDQVHFELFNAPAASPGDHAFEVTLARSGRTFMVAADRTILECLVEQGCDPLYDCKRGECGICAVPVLAGEIDHRDYALSGAERAAGNVIQVCVSRAKGKQLVLDL